MQRTRIPRWVIFLLILIALALLQQTCLDTCTHSNQLHRVPRIHGRVVDARTGRPLAGVRLQRWLERMLILGPGGSEDTIVGGSKICVTTGADGRFEFPGWLGFHGITRANWFAYLPGYMPGLGWYASESQPGKLPSGAPGLREDPWVKVAFIRTGNGVQMTLRLFPPTLEGVTFMAYDVRAGGFRATPPAPREKDVWGEYFNRLRWRAQEQLIPWDDVVRQAIAHVRAHGPIGEVGTDALSDIAGEAKDRRESAEIIDAVHGYLATHPETDAGKRFLADKARIPFEKKLEEREPAWDSYSGDASRLPVQAVISYACNKGMDALLKRLGRPYQQATNLDLPPPKLPHGFRTTLVPTGELERVPASEVSRERLERFVSGGGTLVVMAQVNAENFERVPTPPGERLRVYGYGQAQSAHTDSVVVATDHPITCSAPRGPISLGVDGFIDEWPASGKVLLRRIGDGTAVMVAYPIGAGWVVVSTLYEDRELGEGRGSQDGLELLANLMSWADGPTLPRATCAVGTTCNAEIGLLVTNETRYDTDRIQWRAYDPLKPQSPLATWEEPLQLGAHRSESVALHFRLPDAVQRPGILHVSYHLLDSSFRGKGSSLGAAPLTVAVEPLAAEIVVTRPQAAPTCSLPFGLGLAVESAELPDLTRISAHLSLRAFGTNGFSGAVRLSYGNRNRTRWVPAGSWEVVVPPGGFASDDRALGPIQFGKVVAADAWLRAEAVPTGGTAPIVVSDLFIRTLIPD